MINTIAQILVAPFIFVLSLAGYTIAPQSQVYTVPPSGYENQIREAINEYVEANVNDLTLGAAPDYIAGSTYYLSGTGVSSSATSITLTSLTITQTGQKIVTGDLIAGVGNKFYVTIEPGNRSKQEVVSCTAITQNANGTATLSGCSRGISPITPYTASTTLAFVHGGGSQVIFSNPPNVYRDLVDYMEDALIAGAVDSSLTAKGILEKATGAEAAANAQVGSGNTSAPLALTTDIASSTATVGTSQVVVASTTGYIDPSYLNDVPFLSINNTWTGVNTFSTTTATSTMIGSLPAYHIGKNIAVFTTTGTSTWMLPVGVNKLFVQVQAAGGNGGSGSSGDSDCESGAGGASGGYVEKMVDVSDFQAVALHVGSVGDFTSFGVAASSTYLFAGPGTNGGNNSVTPVAGGSASGGDINIVGTSGGGGGTGSGNGIGGNGAASYFGGGGGGGGCGAAGAAATAYGAGGGGGSGSSGSGGKSGGAGKQGIIRITW